MNRTSFLGWSIDTMVGLGGLGLEIPSRTLVSDEDDTERDMRRFAL